MRFIFRFNLGGASLLVSLLGLWIVYSFNTSSVYAADWTDHARRFTGETDQVRQDAIAELKKDGKLAEKLQKALGTRDHFLALDVISTLKIRSLLPVLIKFSEKDRTGYSYHVINSLMSSQEQPKIARQYQERLVKPRVSAASKMAILDALGRMNVVLKPEHVNLLLHHETPEVRSAMLYFLRNEILKLKRTDSLQFLEIPIRDSAFQIRLQTLYLLSEIPTESRGRVLPSSLKEGIVRCQSDPVPQVKSLCHSLAQTFISGGG